MVEIGMPETVPLFSVVGVADVGRVVLATLGAITGLVMVAVGRACAPAVPTMASVSTPVTSAYLFIFFPLLE